MDTKVNRKEKGCSSRERIIAAAEMLFARQGYAGTGLRELAADAKVNLAMINYFFGSKKELLKEILDSFLAGYLDIAREELAGSDEPQIKLGRFVCRAVCYFESHRDALLVTITELPHDDPEVIEYKAAWGRQMMEIIEREVCRPFAQETGNNLSPRLIGPILTSMMASRFLFAPLMDRLGPGDEIVQGREYAEMISSFCLGGMKGLRDGKEGTCRDCGQIIPDSPFRS